jgi:hypothetical protein
MFVISFAALIIILATAYIITYARLVKRALSAHLVLR